MTIKVGDTVYVLRDWPERQVKAVVTKKHITLLYGRRKRAWLYHCETKTGTMCVHYKEHHYGRKRIVIYKRPLPNVPIDDKQSL